MRTPNMFFECELQRSTCMYQGLRGRRAEILFAASCYPRGPRFRRGASEGVPSRDHALTAGCRPRLRGLMF